MKDDADKSKGRRGVLPPEIVQELERLAPEERFLRLKQYMDEHGEDVDTQDDWTGYGPKVDTSSEPPKPPR